jgi:hypothetical protein
MTTGDGPPLPPPRAPGGDVRSGSGTSPSAPLPVAPVEVESPGLPTLRPVSGTSSVAADPIVVEEFVPLVVDPPPRLFATWWLRYLLFLAQLVGLAIVLFAEYSGDGAVRHSTAAALPYLLAATMLVCWSALAMTDARRLVPATPYQRASSGPLVVALWLLAFAAPVGGFRVVEWARDRFADGPDDARVVVATVGAVMVCFVLVWLPFHYHTIHARRIGAPARIVGAWFWLPLVAGVGALLIGALGLDDALEENGLTDLERTIEVGAVFGLPALVFALTTWRATTVFDEVVDLRWRRWRGEWEQTLHAMAAQPPPRPEGSPQLREG